MLLFPKYPRRCLCRLIARIRLKSLVPIFIYSWLKPRTSDYMGKITSALWSIAASKYKGLEWFCSQYAVCIIFLHVGIWCISTSLLSCHWFLSVARWPQAAWKQAKSPLLQRDSYNLIICELLTCFLLFITQVTKSLLCSI